MAHLPRRELQVPDRFFENSGSTLCHHQRNLLLLPAVTSTVSAVSTVIGRVLPLHQQRKTIRLHHRLPFPDSFWWYLFPAILFPLLPLVGCVPVGSPVSGTTDKSRPHLWKPEPQASASLYNFCAVICTFHYLPNTLSHQIAASTPLYRRTF